MFSLMVVIVYAGALLVLGKEEAEVLERVTQALFYLYVLGSLPAVIMSIVIPLLLTMGGRKIGEGYGHKNIGTAAGAAFGIWAFLWIVLRRVALIGGAYLLTQGQIWGIALIAAEILLGLYLRRNDSDN